MQSVECRINTRVMAAKTKYKKISLDMLYEDQQLVSRELQRAEQGCNSTRVAAVLTAEIILNRYE